MKKILGLDLGTSSIGWAVVSENGDESTIEALGSRIIPLSTEDVNGFTQGNSVSKNASRTMRRAQRKGYDRYQQRRKRLRAFLSERGMLPQENYDKLRLWGLRAKAVSERLTLAEIGRVLLHINQKRGYKATKADYDPEADKKQGDYVKTVMGRHKDIVERGITIGQLFFEKLSADPAYRTKEQVFPRQAYEEEFDRIAACQQAFYPDVLTDEAIGTLRDKIIFYQRGLKSCKHLVSICEFEKGEYIDEKSGKTVVAGPKVAPRTSPLAQVCKIWESVNNLTLTNRKGEKLKITPAQRMAMFEHLDENERLTLTDMYRILEISKSDGWWGGKAIGKGLQGNTTKMAICKALGDGYEYLLRFNLSKKATELVDTETGEIVQIISEGFLNEPLYRLWHLIYSINERTEFENALKKQFGITDPDVVKRLFALDFVKHGYANKSARAMRRILPYLELGLMYSEACDAAGFRHSDSLNKAENQARELFDELPPIEKNELRQPVVEKILNQMINVVNALMEKHGRFDEIRVELARELKQSKDERNETTLRINKTERENKGIAERIAGDYNLPPTRSRIQKYKMWQEADHTCFYCGQPVGAAEFLNGYDVEVEHIIPRSLFFDDGFSNKVCACRKCNKEKNNRTAYDYMRSKSEGEFTSYLERIEKLYKEKKIGKTKYERLLTPADKIPTDFIDRQLRESQYIARKSREILSSVCRDVTSTSGSVTDFIRRTWGWDKVLHNLNFDRYKQAELTEIKEREHNGKKWNEEVIKDWGKRLDHRHHAIDALVIACTKQGYIQRINNMSELKNLIFATDEKQGGEYQESKTRLEKYIQSQPHFSTAEVAKAVDSILVSFKAGKKAASPGKRYIYRGGKRILKQSEIVVPRGALHEDSVSGNILRYDKKGNLVSENVMKYKVGVGQGCLFGAKDDKKKIDKTIDAIVDKGIAKIVKERVESKNYELKSLFSEPLMFNGREIRSVRCFTGNKAVVSVGNGFVLTGNNHHIAIYVDRDGKRHESCVTFWHAVERKKHRIPVVITQPDEVWDHLPTDLSEEFFAQLPRPDWTFEICLGQNEMFVLGLEPDEFEEAMRERDYAVLGKHLYRIQSIGSNDYWFRLHTETANDKTKEGGIAKKYYRFKSLGAFFGASPKKMRISLLGEIIGS
jgi:CRISPR-associated endonuclease Csn1